MPVEITFGSNPDSKITYIYTASGKKVEKVVRSTPQSSSTAVNNTTDYCNGFQYYNTVLQFFPTAKGYVKNTVTAGVNKYNYVFHYTDNVGNIRMSYAEDPATHSLKILEENHYYPYGLKHSSYNANLNAFAAKNETASVTIMAAADAELW